MTTADDIVQLQAQQSLTVQTLRAMLEGHWSGEPPSVEALLLAINPTLEPMATVDYLLTSEAGEVIGPDWWTSFNFDEPMPRQAASWTCSACSLAWVERATGVNAVADEWSAVDEIGRPENINPTYGLMDGSGSQLRRVLRDLYDIESSQGWLSFDQAYAIYGNTTGMMSGGAWYHWVALRGTINSDLHIANSAPGYQSVWDVLTRDDWNRLGPFSCVWLEK